MDPGRICPQKFVWVQETRVSGFPQASQEKEEDEGGRLGSRRRRGSLGWHPKKKRGETSLECVKVQVYIAVMPSKVSRTQESLLSFRERKERG